MAVVRGSDECMQRQPMEQSVSCCRFGQKYLVQRVCRAAEAPGPGAVLQFERNPVYRADLRASSAISLSQATVRTDSLLGGGAAGSTIFRQEGEPTAG